MKKPSWQPPDWLFPVAWTAIFAMIAVSAALGWLGANTADARWMIVGLFALNAVLNLAWSVLFFTLKRPDWALYEVVLLWLSIVALLIVLAPVSRVATLLLVPYFIWVSFAAYLNLAIVRLNP